MCFKAYRLELNRCGSQFFQAMSPGGNHFVSLCLDSSPVNRTKTVLTGSIVVRVAWGASKKHLWACPQSKPWKCASLPKLRGGIQEIRSYPYSQPQVITSVVFMKIASDLAKNVSSYHLRKMGLWGLMLGRFLNRAEEGGKERTNWILLPQMVIIPFCPLEFSTKFMKFCKIKLQKNPHFPQNVRNLKT